MKPEPFTRLYTYERAAQLERRRLKAKLARLAIKADQDGPPWNGSVDTREGYSTGYLRGLRDARAAL